MRSFKTSSILDEKSMGRIFIFACTVRKFVQECPCPLGLKNLFEGLNYYTSQRAVIQYLRCGQAGRAERLLHVASTLRWMTFGTDPTYQAALDAATRSSVLAATSHPLTFAPSSSPSPPPPTTQAQSTLIPNRHLSTHAAASRPRPSSAPRPTPDAETEGQEATPPTSSSSSPPAADSETSLFVERGPRSREFSSAAPAPQPPLHATARAGSGQAGGPPIGRQARADRRGQQQEQRQSRGLVNGALQGSESGSAAEAASEAQLSNTRLEVGGTRLGPRTEEAAGMKRTGAGAKKESGWFGSYHEHLPPGDLSAGLKSGRLFRGKIRINTGNIAEAYVTVPGLPHDLLVRGELSRNRAVEGDEVAVQVQLPTAWFVRNKGSQQQQQQRADGGTQVMGGGPSEEIPWQSCTSPDQVKQVLCDLLAARTELRATAKVVGILDLSPKRNQLVGLLRLVDRLPDTSLPPWDPSSGLAMPASLNAAVEAARAAALQLHLVPLDPRLPTCRVEADKVFNVSLALLVGLLRGEEAASRTLVSGLLLSWPPSSQQPLAGLRSSLGQAGEIESETAAILEGQGIRATDFEPKVLACLPPLPWRIGERELAGRRDFRSQRVFSIDPPTAKDLDDALSIEPLSEWGTEGDGAAWRVGVHIADVSHFIEPFSALDVEAGLRSTSTYLVQRVVPMLPPLLCEQLCSLNPGEDRLTFSVVWDMDKQGNILSTWFGRSVIRSCAKLTYPLVQKMIEGEFRPEDTGVPLHGGEVSWEQVVSDSLSLWSVARQLRESRFRGGALRLDNTRLFFSMDKDGNPVAAAPYVQKEANQLVEEFMVLANISVAKFISQVFPDRAMLRRHPPPNDTKMQELREAAEAAGVSLDVTSAASLQTTLNALRASAPPPPPAAEEEGVCVGLLSATARHRRKVELLVMLATRPMQLAKYFSTGSLDQAQRLWRHYALAIDHYTHFTSPIRRYPDVVVHRQLAAALDVTQGGLSVEEAARKHKLLDPSLTERVADHCNDRRLAARDAQDASLRLYLCILLARQPRIVLGTVNGLGGDLFFSAYLSEFGAEVTVTLGKTGVPLTAEWNQGARVLSLTRGSPTPLDGADGAITTAIGRKQRSQGGGGGSGGGGDGGGRAGRRGQQSQASGSGVRSRGNGGGKSTASNSSGNPGLVEWVESLPPFRNPHGLQSVSLPLHLRQFDDVPLLVTAELVAGEAPRLVARMYFREAERAVEESVRRRAEEEAAAAAAAAASIAAEAVAEGPEVEETEGGIGTAVRQSMVPSDNMLLD